MEEEKSSELPLLDGFIHLHDDGELSTRVYRKIINTDRIRPFDSNYPVANKINCIRKSFNHINTHWSISDSKKSEESCTASSTSMDTSPILYKDMNNKPTHGNNPGRYEMAINSNGSLSPTSAQRQRQLQGFSSFLIVQRWLPN